MVNTVSRKDSRKNATRHFHARFTTAKSRFSKDALSLAVLLATAVATGDSVAQELEEILVTAQKRTESLQDTPIAMSALNAEAIEARGIINAVDFGQSSPNIQMPAYPFSNNNVALFIRGIGNADSIVITKDHTVGVYYDGVYAARSTGLLADLSDLERIEILRGPQGTLYGRNTTAGAVNFINAKPTGEFGIKQVLGAGNFGSWRSVTHLNFDDMGGFKAKATATFSDRDGWVENEGPNEVAGYPYEDYYQRETEGYRIALRYDGTERVLVDYSFDYSEQTHTPGYFQYAGPVGGFTLAGEAITDRFPERLEETRTPLGGGANAYYLPQSETEVEGHNLTISYELSDSLTLKSITGYREMDDNASQNFSQSFGGAGTLQTNTLTDHEQFSQELQLVGSGERLNYVAGFFYFDESGEQAERQFLDRALVDELGIFALDFLTGGTPCGGALAGGVPDCTDLGFTFPAFLGEYIVETDVESWALFGQATWTPDMLDDKLDLTLGLRYTDDDRSADRTFDSWPFNSFAPGSSGSEEEVVDYTLIADYEITDEVSTYAKVSTGFRSGGSSRNALDFNQAFEKEELISYEAGLKSELLERRLRLNTAVFFMQVDDIILDYLPDPVDNPQFVEVFNSGDADIWGVEIDSEFLVTENLSLTANYAYLDYDINDAIFPDGSDRTDTTELLWAPEHALAIGADYDVALSFGDLRFHVDYSWQDEQFALANTDNGEFKVDEFGLLNARISLASVDIAGGDWQFALWGKNLTDEDKPNYLIGGTAFTHLAPLMWGAEVIFEY